MQFTLRLFLPLVTRKGVRYSLHELRSITACLLKTRGVSVSDCCTHGYILRLDPRTSQEIEWPDAAERHAHADFLQTHAHPDMPRIAYIADGTVVGMRNPSRVS